MGKLCNYPKTRFNYKSCKNSYQVLQVLQEFVSGTTSLARIRIRYYKSCENSYQVLQVLQEFLSGTTSFVATSQHAMSSYDKFITTIIPRYTRYKLHHGDDYTVLAYRIPGCVPASRLI